MTLTNGINHVAVITTDLDRFVTFYGEVFEMPVLFRETTPAFRHAILRSGATSWLHPAALVDNAHGVGLPDMFRRGHLDHLALTAASRQAFDLVRDRLVERGASDGKVEDLGSFHALWFRDPDGMRGELCLIVDPKLRVFHAPQPLNADASSSPG
jgi:catechol 2,3-dioxygenase-like lactoylglutathione lyase family enzyme